MHASGNQPILKKSSGRNSAYGAGMATNPDRDAFQTWDKSNSDRTILIMALVPISPRVTIAGVPIHVMIVPFPIVCFTGAMITDIVYSRTADIQWANFSAWLLAFGLLMGSLAALFGMIDFFRAGPKPIIGWVHLFGNLGILAIALINNLVHARDGWTSVVPLGLTLSVITVLMMLVTGFLGYLMVFRHLVRQVVIHPAVRTGNGL